MTHDEEALLQSILADPEDDSLRLVYADLLEENGQPERADFIRVQIALASLPDLDRRRAELEPRERALLKQHGEDWVGSLRPFVVSCWFGRGFVAGATVTPEVYLEHAAFLPRLAPIRHIEVSLAQATISPAITELVPEAVARDLHLLPIGWRGGRLVVAMAFPDHIDSTQLLRHIRRLDIEPVQAPLEQMFDAINRNYGGTAEEAACTPEYEEERLVRFEDPADGRSSVALIVNLVVQEALCLRATEVRIEPEGDVYQVRCCIDGQLVDRDRFPCRLLWMMLERVRLLSAAEPGHIRVLRDGTLIDLSVRIEETVHGPRVIFAT